MIYAKLDVEWFEDPAYYDLRDADRLHPERFLRCVAWAKRCNSGGLILRSDGIPLDARAMARIHDGPGPSSTRTWESFLELCQEIGLLVLSEGGWKIVHWKRWHSSPSDSAENVRERVARHREARKAKNKAKKAVPFVTNCNECNETEQSIAEHSRACTEHSIAKHGSIDPPLPPTGGDDRPMDSGRYRSGGEDDAGGAPPAPPPSPGRRDFTSVDEAFSAVCREVSSKPLQGPDVQRLETLKGEAKARGATDEEIFVALRYGAAATRWALNSGVKPIKQPRAYLLACTLEVLPRVQERSQDQRIALQQGWTQPQQIAWVDPDPSGGVI